MGVQDAVKEEVEKNLGIFGSRTRNQAEGTLLKAAAHRLVEGKGRGFDVVGTEGTGANSFLDDSLDETDMGEVQIKHMRSLRMVGRSCEEVTFEQQGLKKIAAGIAELKASLN